MTRRYPWDEFWQWAEARGWTLNAVARALGDPRNLYRWRASGAIPEASADRLALAVGTMPGEVWASWDADGLAVAEAEDARRRAAAVERVRRRRAESPEYAERQRAVARAWKAACPEYVKAYRDDYYKRNRERLIRQSVERKRRWRAAKRTSATRNPRSEGAELLDVHPEMSCPSATIETADQEVA
jgi:hypothetical protein